jgi:Hemerythrin HHE cation binding domain
MDPIEILREDHNRIQEAFEEFAGARDTEIKRILVNGVLDELKVHAAIEEEIFYPAVRQTIAADSIINLAIEEHHLAKVLIAELEKMEPSDERYDAKFLVLIESVRHHITQEEMQVLIKAKEAALNFRSLAYQMLKKKQQVLDSLAEEHRLLKHRAQVIPSPVEASTSGPCEGLAYSAEDSITNRQLEHAVRERKLSLDYG